MENRISVFLTPQELAELNGKCRPEIQSKVDKAVNYLIELQLVPQTNEKLASYLAQLKITAIEEGKLDFRYCSLRECAICDKKAGYAKYTRTTFYHKKGALKYDKPLYIPCVEFTRSFISNHNKLGICTKCWDSYKEEIKSYISNLKIELCDELYTSGPKYKKLRLERARRTSFATSSSNGWYISWRMSFLS